MKRTPNFEKWQLRTSKRKNNYFQNAFLSVLDEVNLLRFFWEKGDASESWKCKMFGLGPECRKVRPLRFIRDAWAFKNFTFLY